MSIISKLQSIGSAIREKLGETELIPLGEMADKVRKIYDKGAEIAQKKPYIDTSEITSFQNFASYNNSITLMLDKLDTSNGTNFQNMCVSSNTLKTFPSINTSKGNAFSGMFQACSELVQTEEFDTSNGRYFDRMFYSCKKLVTISKLNLSRQTSAFVNVFLNCEKLENLGLEGTIGASGLDLSFSPNLSTASVLKVLHALEDKSGESGTWKLTLGEDNIAKISEEDLNAAKNKGWTVV